MVRNSLGILLFIGSTVACGPKRVEPHLRSTQNFGGRWVSVSKSVDAPAETVFRVLMTQLVPSACADISTAHRSYVLPQSWPVRDRWVQDRVEFSHDERTGVFHVQIQEHAQSDVRAKHLVTVESIDQVILVIPDGPRHSTVIGEASIDFGGSLRRRRTDPAVRRALHRIFEDVEAAIQPNTPTPRCGGNDGLE